MRTALPLILLALHACRAPERQPPQPPVPPAAPASSADMGAIVGVNVAWGNLLVTGDLPGLAGLYVEDAVLMTPEGDVAGRDAIRAWFEAERARRDSIHATATDTDELDVAGERAYEAGTLTYTVAPRARPTETRHVRVRYVTFWRRAAGGLWMIARSLRPLP